MQISRSIFSTLTQKPIILGDPFDFKKNLLYWIDPDYDSAIDFWVKRHHCDTHLGVDLFYCCHRIHGDVRGTYTTNEEIIERVRSQFPSDYNIVLIRVTQLFDTTYSAFYIALKSVNPTLHYLTINQLLSSSDE